MRLGRHILSFALALLWLALPVHCQLEVVSAAALLSCADGAGCSSPADESCADDFCASIESGRYCPQKGAVAAKIPVGALLPWQAHLDSLPLLAETELAPRAFAFPILGASWQFVQRAAAPPRAPTSLS